MCNEPLVVRCSAACCMSKLSSRFRHVYWHTGCAICAMVRSYMYVCHRYWLLIDVTWNKLYDWTVALYWQLRCWMHAMSLHCSNRMAHWSIVASLSWFSKLPGTIMMEQSRYCLHCYLYSCLRVCKVWLWVWPRYPKARVFVVYEHRSSQTISTDRTPWEILLYSSKTLSSCVLQLHRMM